ncbi:MAG: ABC transporter substrate-binding protein [Candidatus Bathyarchaeota archaeon]
MKKGLIVLLFIVIILSVISIAYFSTTTTTQKPTTTMTVTDSRGKNVVIANYPPQRIVSIAPANTEILFALGLDDKIVGVTQYCDYPPKVKKMVEEGKITIIGGFANPNVEKIVELKPDVVFAMHTVQLKGVEALENKGIPVVFLDPKNVQEILDSVMLVGKATGKEDEAGKLVKEMKQRIDYITSKTRDVSYKPKVYYEVWHDPLMSIGPDTFVNELIELAGGVNIFYDAKTSYPTISPESVIERKPEIIIIKIGYMGGVAKEEIAKRPGWDTIDAVKIGKIYEVEENILIRPGPRIVEGLETLAKILHPELFS